MNYELLLNEILNIGKDMIKSGAETDRAEDSMYRMLESYELEQCSVFAIQSNIQATIKPKGGHFMTQIRRIHKIEFNYDRLDYLNNLSRYICKVCRGLKPQATAGIFKVCGGCFRRRGFRRIFRLRLDGYDCGNYNLRGCGGVFGEHP